MRFCYFERLRDRYATFIFVMKTERRQNDNAEFRNFSLENLENGFFREAMSNFMAKYSNIDIYPA